MGWRDWFRPASPREIPDALWAEACIAFPFLGHLTVDEQKTLKLLAEAFLAEKEFSGAGGLHVDDRMRVTIALQGCLPILHLGLSGYRDWVGIIVYPDEFRVHRQVEDENGIVHEYDEMIAGEAWVGGPLLISWRDVELANTDYNVVIHEFVHKLDQLNGEADGIPALHGDLSAGSWHTTLEAAYQDFCQRVDAGEATQIDPYASDHPAEFFAVLSEVFFSAPEVVADDYPDFFDLLRRYYRQDPRVRLR